MRDYPGIPFSALPDPKALDFLPRLRNSLGTIDAWARDASQAVGLIAGNRQPSQGGTNPIVGSGGSPPFPDGDYGDVSVSGVGTHLKVDSAAQTIYLKVGEDIQVALDQLTSGGVVFLEPGLWPLTAGLHLRNPGLTLRGSGRGITQLYYIIDPNTDIITIENTYCTVEDLGVYGVVPTSSANGAATPGTGRGIVIAQSDALYNGTTSFPTIRRVDVQCTPSWCIYDTGLSYFNTGGNNWSGLSGPTGKAISIQLTIEDVGVAFWGSDGGLFLGSGTAAPIIRGLKTNGYSYNTFTTLTETNKSDMGGVFMYNVFGALFDGDCYFQSPSDGGILPDTDATMLSMLNCTQMTFEAPIFEVLSSTCADSNNGAGGRQYYFVTAANSGRLVFNNANFQSRMSDGGSTLSNYGVKIMRTPLSVGGVGVTFNGGLAIQGRTTILAAPGAGREIGDPVTWDRNDFVFGGDVDGEKGGPIVIRDFVIENNSTGKLREPTTPKDAFNVAGCSTAGVPDVNLTTTASFVDVNRGDVVSGTGVTAGTLVQYVTGLTTIVLDQNATVPIGTTLTFTPPGRNIMRRPCVIWEDKRGPVRLGHFDTCDLTGAGNVNDLDARWLLSHNALEGILGYVRASDDTEGLWIGSLLGNTFKQVATIRKRSSAFPSPVIADLWYDTTNKAFSTYDGSAWFTALEIAKGTGSSGALPYYTGAYAASPLAVGGNGAVLTVASSLPAWLALGTTDYLLTAGASSAAWAAPEFKDNLFRVVDDGSPTKKLAFQISGITTGTTRTWTAPDVDGTVALSTSANLQDSSFTVFDNSDSTKKVALECSGITASTTRTWGVLDVPGSPCISGNGADPPATGAIGRVNRTAQVADIATTKLTDTTPAGFYVIHAVLEDTTADVTAGTVTVTFSWTDDVGATTDATLSQTLIATGRSRLTLPLYLASGNITYAVAHTGIFGTAAYALRIRCQFLG